MIPKKRPIAPPQADSDDGDDAADVEEQAAPRYAMKRMPTKRPRQQHPDEDEDSEDEESTSGAKGASGAVADGLSDDSDLDDDDDEDDDEDEDEDDDGAVDRPQTGFKRPRKGTKMPQVVAPRRAANPFIQEEAEVDTSDEEEDADDDDDLEEEFLDKDEELAAQRVQSDLHQSYDRRRDTDQEFDPEAITQRLQQRYGRAYGDAMGASGAYRGDQQHVPMQFLLPTAKDPNLWLVRCKPGRETDVALNMMRKYLDYLSTAQPLRIFSIISRPTLKGYIYVEARSMGDVQAALDKTNNVYLSRISLIPREEMVDILTIRRQESRLNPGAWVRMGRGKFKGDLAQVLEIAENNDSIRVKLVPRLDFTAKRRQATEGPGGKRRSAVRAPQRFFNPKDVDKSDRTLTRSRGYWVWGSDMYDKNGFLERDVKLASVDTENVQPTLEEIAKFSSATATDTTADGGLDVTGQQLKMVSLAEAGGDANTAGSAAVDRFQPGDLVTVTEGDLVNAQGIVKSVTAQSVTLSMKDEQLGEIMVEPHRIVKAFQVGDHIRVFRGKYKDMKGMVTQVQGDIVTAFSDSSMEQFSVFLRDIQSVGEVAMHDPASAIYAQHDFVQIGATNVGVIIAVEMDQYRVLDQSGAVITVKTQEITQKRDTKRAVSMDSAQNTIQVGDVVQVLSGEHAKKTGVIMHLYRTWAFLYHRDMSDTSGVFVARTRMVIKTGGGGAVRSLSGGPMSQGPAANGIFRVPGPPGSGGGQGRFDPLMQKRIVIIGGPYKGYQGVVKTVSEQGAARIELNTNGRIVTVDRNKIRPQDGTGRNSGYSSSSSSRFQGGMTPMVGSRTPNPYAGAQTPNVHDGVGGRTPAWDAGSRTPAWDAGSRTPGGWGGGGDTGGAGGRTPAWDAGSRTPMVYSGGRDSHFDRSGEAASADAPSQYSTDANTAANSAVTEWVQPQMEVSIREGPFAASHGKVLSVSSGASGAGMMCQLEILSSPSSQHAGQTANVRTSTVDPVAPSKKDKCVFLAGDAMAGETGQLIGMDGGDAIVKMDSNSDFKITPLRAVCKVVAD